MNDLMPEGWEPRKRGRKPIADHTPLLRKAQSEPDRWVAFSTYSMPEIRSLVRQLKLVSGVDTSVEQPGGRSPVLYVKWEENHQLALELEGLDDE